MATIKISNLHPTGSELFSDAESYMSEVKDNDLNYINGGIIMFHTTTHMLTHQLPYYFNILP
jgi:hypothetical protein